MLDHDEVIEILEDIARNSRSAVARIHAIKVLRTLEDERPEPSAFDELYEVDAKAQIRATGTRRSALALAAPIRP